MPPRMAIEATTRRSVGGSPRKATPPAAAITGTHSCTVAALAPVSDGSTAYYRTRIRTPSFAHMQFVPCISRGYTVADLMAILGSVDYVLSDIDR